MTERPIVRLRALHPVKLFTHPSLRTLAVLLCLAVGCTKSTPSVEVNISFAPTALGQTADRIELFLVDDCNDTIVGTRPTGFAVNATVHDDGTTTGLGNIPDGTFGVHAYAMSDDCEVVAVNTCTVVDIEGPTDMVISIILIPYTQSMCPIGTQCALNTCSPDAGMPDASGTDGGVSDAGPDAGTQFEATFVYRTSTQSTAPTFPLDGATIDSPFRATLEFAALNDPGGTITRVDWYLLGSGDAPTVQSLYRNDDLNEPYDSTYTASNLMPIGSDFIGLDDAGNGPSNNTFRFVPGETYQFVGRAIYVQGGSDDFKATFSITN